MRNHKIYLVCIIAHTNTSSILEPRNILIFLTNKKYNKRKRVACLACFFAREKSAFPIELLAQKFSKFMCVEACIPAHNFDRHSHSIHSACRRRYNCINNPTIAYDQHEKCIFPSKNVAVVDNFRRKRLESNRLAFG